jgi:hypothetical protein
VKHVTVLPRKGNWKAMLTCFSLFRYRLCRPDDVRSAHALYLHAARAVPAAVRVSRGRAGTRRPGKSSYVSPRLTAHCQLSKVDAGMMGATAARRRYRGLLSTAVMGIAKEAPGAIGSLWPRSAFWRRSLSSSSPPRTRLSSASTTVRGVIRGSGSAGIGA